MNEFLVRGTPSVINFQSKILSQQAKPNDYSIYRAGLEWDLTDPIVIDSPDDFKSKPRWRERLEPYHHQVRNLITFCRRLPVTLLADDVGLGKTISAGLVMSELIARARLSKVLIVCPKVLGPQWREELQSKFDMPAIFATGRELLRVREASPRDLRRIQENARTSSSSDWRHIRSRGQYNCWPHFGGQTNATGWIAR
jgi:SNF2 family DNA or RNA helicase